jgi:hypothetical protein
MPFAYNVHDTKYHTRCNRKLWPSVATWSLHLMTRNAQINHFRCEHEVFGYDFWTISDQNPPVASHIDLFMHFLAMCCNGQAATDSCNGQVFF